MKAEVDLDALLAALILVPGTGGGVGFLTVAFFAGGVFVTGFFACAFTEVAKISMRDNMIPILNLLIVLD